MYLRPSHLIPVVAGLAAALACSSAELPPASLPNLQDTVTLGALYSSPIGLPSAYSITEGMAVRTDQNSSFDFVYDVLPDQRRVFMPLAAIGMEIPGRTNPGLMRYDGTFESLTNAPSSGYSIYDTLTLAVNDVIVGRSRVVCYLSVPQYAKMKILAFDDAARTVTFEIIDGLECGYRSLRPGVPEN